MDISLEIDEVYRRASLLSQRATELPVTASLVAEAVGELHFVLEELQAAREEMRRQYQQFTDSRLEIERKFQHYQSLFELAPEGYIVTDQQGNIHSANRAAARLLACTPEYLLLKPLLVFIDEPERLRFQTRLINLNANKSVLSDGIPIPSMTHLNKWEVTLAPGRDVRRSALISVTCLPLDATDDVALLWLFREQPEVYAKKG